MENIIFSMMKFLKEWQARIKNKIKITGTDCLEIMKSGVTSSHMVFEKNKKNLTYYKTALWSDAGRRKYKKYGDQRRRRSDRR